MKAPAGPRTTGFRTPGEGSSVLISVATRLGKPAIAAVALFSVLYTCNDYFLPLLYLSENPSKNGAEARSAASAQAAES